MELVCINCPRGCHLNVEKVNDEIAVSGNSCLRGKTYAVNELTNPLRVLTTTVSIDSEYEERLPVISSVPLPKDRVMDVSKALKEVRVSAPVKMKDVIVENILGLGIDIIASKTINR